MSTVEVSLSEMQELKKIETDILRSFIGVCQKLGVKYYVLGGTLLGAVRHKGFIPWDDDIDVGMPREDYEKLLKFGQDLLPEGLFLQTFRTDPEYPANFAKIRRSNTTFVEYSIKDRKINHGVYIDIFPLDFYPNKNRRLFEARKLLLTLRITDTFTPSKMKFKTKALRIVSRILYPSVKIAVEKREKLFSSVKPSDMIANYCGAWGKKEIVPKHWYGDGAELDFEGIKVSAPALCHEWLTQVYGDYMLLPPPEKRTPHHFVEIIDLERPYTYYKERE